MELIEFLKDKNEIHFKGGNEPLPNTFKKFRQTPELRSLYAFIYENDLRKEAFQIINEIFKIRKKQKINPSKLKKSK